MDWPTRYSHIAVGGNEVEDRYNELVERAEKAVAGVKDPELRRVAFEKILTDLLSGGSSTAEATGKSDRGAPRRKPKAKPSSAAQKRRGGPQGYVQEMIEDGFFDKPKTMAEVKAELENRGHHIPFTSLSTPLARLTRSRELRRGRTASKGKKQTFRYSRW